MPKRSAIDQQLRDAIAKAEAQGLREPHLHRIANGEAIPKITTAAAILDAIGGSFTIRPPRKRKA